MDQQFFLIIFIKDLNGCLFCLDNTLNESFILHGEWKLVGTRVGKREQTNYIQEIQTIKSNKNYFLCTHIDHKK